VQRICLWYGATLRRATIIRLILHTLRQKGLDTDAVIAKITVVTQKRDAQPRADIYVKLKAAERVLRTLRSAPTTNRWRSRAHIQYARRQHTPGAASSADDDGRAKETAAVRSEGNTLTLCSWNIRGFREKREELGLFVKKKGVDILCLQETLMKTGSPKLIGFRTTHQVCSGEGARGVAVVSKDDLPVVNTGVDSEQVCWVRVLGRSPPLIVASVYCPAHAGARREMLKSLGKQVEGIQRRNPDAQLVMIGDWNLSRPKLEKVLARWGLGLKVAQVTGSDKTWHSWSNARLSWSGIDHVVVSTNKALKVSVKVVRTWDLSDHFPLVIKITSAKDKGSKLGDEFEEPRLVMRRQLIPKKAEVIRNHNRFAALAAELEESELLRDDAVEAMDEGDGEEGAASAATTTSARNKDIEQVGAKFAKVNKAVALEVGVAKMNKGDSRLKDKKRPDVLSTDTRKAIRSRRRIWAKMLAAMRINDRAAWLGLRKQHRVAMKAARDAIKTDREKAWADFVEEGVCHLADHRNHKLFWGWVKQLTGQRTRLSGVTPIKNSAGELLLDPEKIAQEWLDHYGRLAGDPTGHSGDEQHWADKVVGPRLETLEGLDDLPSWYETNACIQGMQKTKAAGLSGITPDWVALAGDMGPLELDAEPSSPFGRVVFSFIRIMFKHGYVPRCLNTALVVSIPKKGDLSLIDNYRGISLIEIVLKVAAGIVNRRLSNALEVKDLLIKEQAGFRPEEECISQVVTLYEICVRRKIDGADTYLAFIDFKKAFDTVCHGAVLAKLDHLGVRGWTLAFIRALYKGSAVTVAGAAGQLVPLRRGVRQGCPASPLLFNVFINDILTECRDLGVVVPGLAMEGGNRICGLLQADDLVLLASSPEDLQAMLNKVADWADKFEMSTNAAKCGVMGIGEEAIQEAKVVEWHLQGQRVPQVEKYRYLGVAFNERLDLDEMMSDRALATLKARMGLQSFLSSTTIPLRARAMVLKAVVTAVAAYGGELLGMEEQRCRKVQSEVDAASRWLVGSSEKTRIASASTIRMEIGLPSMAARLAAARTRALRKWAHAKTWIGRLIREPMSSRKRTWVTGSIRWLSGYGPSAQVREAEAAKSPGGVLSVTAECRLVRACVEDRREKGEGLSISETYYVESGFRATAGALMAVCSGVGMEARAMVMIVRLRCGFFWTGLRAAQARIIDAAYFEKCPCCGAEGPETAEHYLLECSQWNEGREEMMTLIGVERLLMVHWFVLSGRSRMTLLLGGELAGKRLRNWSGNETRLENTGKVPNTAVGEPTVVMCLLGFIKRTRAERNSALWSSAKSRRPYGYGSSS
jgi:exonuclease III